MPHVGGREKLPLLHVDRPPRRGGRQEQIGLPTKKSRYLQQFADLTDRAGLIGQVDVGRHRQTGGLPYLVENRQPFVDSQAAKRPATRAVGLIEGPLEDDLDRQPLREHGQRIGDLEAEILALDDAGAGDDQQWISRATAMSTDAGRQAGVHRDDLRMKLAVEE